ncbi:MAG TPA: biotin/lipoyl-containing protein [Pseudonocardiaceae bacterium]|nr:biotin/lipoyl-containing protein [Pseudonocardiaceae bacterium]
MIISSPMVGTFYRAPDPGSDPFVQVGDVVDEDQTVAVIEAMKLFNPISADCTGVVTEILAVDAQPVEFGQPLIRVTPDPGSIYHASVGRAGTDPIATTNSHG